MSRFLRCCLVLIVAVLVLAGVALYAFRAFIDASVDLLQQFLGLQVKGNAAVLDRVHRVLPGATPDPPYLGISMSLANGNEVATFAGPDAQHDLRWTIAWPAFSTTPVPPDAPVQGVLTSNREVFTVNGQQVSFTHVVTKGAPSTQTSYRGLVDGVDHRPVTIQVTGATAHLNHDQVARFLATVHFESASASPTTLPTARAAASPTPTAAREGKHAKPLPH